MSCAVPGTRLPRNKRWAWTMRIVLRSAPLAVMLEQVGCEDLPEVRYVTERVELAPYADEPVCVGTLADLERFAREIEDRTELARDDRIRFYWGAAGLSECRPRAGGCSDPSAGVVFGSLTSAPHEFAHAIGGVLGTSTHLLEEGFAINAAEECASVDHGLLPSEAHRLAESSLLDFHQGGGPSVGASFTNYLIERFGRQRYHQLKASVPHSASLDRFEDAVLAEYGIALDELEQDWAQKAPLDSCGDRSRLSRFDEGQSLAYMLAPMTLSATLACDEATTKGPIDPTVVHNDPFSNNPVLPGMYADFTLIVPFPVEVVVTFEAAPDATAYLHRAVCWGSTLDGEATTLASEPVSGGESRPALLGACAWYVVLTTPDYEDAAVHLHIDPVDDG